MKSILSIVIMLFCSAGMAAQEDDMTIAMHDSIGIASPLPEGEGLGVGSASVSAHRRLPWWRRVIRGFSKIDTNYIEPQAYNFTVMLQNTNTFEGYTMRNKNGQGVRFSPRPSYKLGPYIGWRWVFLGYTIDLAATSGGARQSINLSLYANQVGVDLFYRKSGDNYRVERTWIGNGVNTKAMRHADFNGFESSEKGFNFYYIFNHHKFSYPAAYSQSTIQRKSCGTALAGISYSRHSLTIDWQKYFALLDEKLGEGTAAANLDTTYHTAKIQYTDFSLSGGYAYNWVFAKNWLFDISLQAALGYKQSHSDVDRQRNGLFRNFDFHNFNIDGVSRIAIVWNNMRWYAGASAIFHTYNYRRSQFRSNTTFGNINIYVGFNFGRKG